MLAGTVAIGEYSFVGTGASVNHGVSIGADCVIGAGAVVISDIPSGSVAIGCPARVTRTRSRLDPYL